MAKSVTVVVSQGQSHNPAQRKLEEDIVAGLLGERGVEVAVLPHLYDLTADGTGVLCLQGISGHIIVLSWMFPRTARWILNRNGIQGKEGTTLLVQDADDEEEEDEFDEQQDDKPRVVDSLPIPDRKIYCIDFRVSNDANPYLDEIRRIVGEVNTATVGLTDWLAGTPNPEHVQRLIEPLPGNIESQSLAGNGNGSAAAPVVVTEDTERRWYPVIDFSRCTNCMECIDFCLFGVYGADHADTILVEQPDNCRKGCPACSRVCPENAIMFPQHKTPAIAGSSEVAGSLKIDLSKLFGAPEADAVDVAVLERDEQLLLAGREAVGRTVGLAKRQEQAEQAEKDHLDELIDQLDDMDL